MNRYLRRAAALLSAAVLGFGCLLPDAASAPPVLRASAADVEIPGIDVSKYQEEIDWQAVADGGVKFAILRCCKVNHAYNDWEIDSRFEENYTGAKAAGLAVGCYIFTDAATEREFSEDVDFMLTALQDKSFEFPVFLDLESATRQEHLPPKVFMPGMLSALQKIEEAGHTAGVYSSSAFFTECIDRDQLRDLGYAVWEANYFNSVNGLATTSGHDLSDRATIWQYSGCGWAAGVNTNVDRNVCYTYQYFTHMAELKEGVLPTGSLTPGADFTLSGTITSVNVIRTITGAIYDVNAPDQPLQSVTVFPHAREYRIAGFFTKKLVFSALAEGSYQLRISAVDSAGAEISVAAADFTVGNPAPVVQSGTAVDPSQPAVTAVTQETGLGAPVEESSTVTAAPSPKTRGGLGMRFTAWFYRHLPLRKILSGAARLGLKLGLERTPLYRIVLRISSRMESGYLAAVVSLNLTE